MIVVGLKNHTFFLVEGSFDNGIFILEKLYESHVQNDLDDLNDSAVREVMIDEIYKVVDKNKMATDNVAILISNQKLKKYIFETDSSVSEELSLTKLLSTELLQSLDLYFYPDEKNYYLLDKIGKNGNLDVHLVLEMNKNMVSVLENFKQELKAESLTVVPEWSGLYNFLEEFKDNIGNLLVVDDTNLPYLEITALKENHIFNVFGVYIEGNETFHSFLSDYIQTHFLESPPEILQLGKSELLSGLNLRFFDLNHFSNKLQSSANLNLHQIKSFFSLIGMLK